MCILFVKDKTEIEWMQLNHSDKIIDNINTCLNAGTVAFYLYCSHLVEFSFSFFFKEKYVGLQTLLLKWNKTKNKSTAVFIKIKMPTM